MRTFLLVLVALLLGILAVTRFWPAVERVEVVGTEHHEPASVLRLARIAPGDPLLWITRWRVAALERDPWILRARVIRHWPDTVSVRVWERVPLARGGAGADAVVWAEDGTVLTDVTEEERATLPLLRGWGDDRTEEALSLLRLLMEREPEVVQYSPEGFEIELSDTVLFTPDIAALRRHWAAVESHRGGRLAVYPWGVSKGE